jgi:hypothetical protein
MSCDTRVLHVQRQQSTASVPAADLDAFTKTPLANMGLQFTTKCTPVAATLVHSELQMVGGQALLPFDISMHSIANTPLSQENLRVRAFYCNPVFPRARLRTP